MELFENEIGARERAGARSKGESLPAPGGGSERKAPAARGALPALLARATKSVWAPVVAKAAGIVAGMLVLAAVGASSIARGSGVPVPPASGRPTTGFVAGGMTAPGALAERPPASLADTPPADAGTTPSAGMTADGRVILNRASADELRHLPGIGAKRAEAIVLLRTKLGGRFKRVTDLLRVKGIGPKGLRKMEPHLVLDPPAA